MFPVYQSSPLPQHPYPLTPAVATSPSATPPPMPLNDRDRHASMSEVLLDTERVQYSTEQPFDSTC